MMVRHQLPLLLLLLSATGVTGAGAADEATVIFQDYRAPTPGSRQNNFTQQQQTFVLALAGLANRDAPRLYLNVTNENMSYNNSGLAWADWIGKHKGLRFAPQHDGGAGGVCRLAQQLAPSHANGLVLWDDKVSPQCYIAMRTLATTIAGLDSLLPATPTMLQDSSWACWDGKGLQSLAVARNLTAELEEAGVFADSDCNAAANEWGVKTLLPKTNRTAVFAIANNAGSFWLAADYAVSQRMYAFSLEPNASVNAREAALFHQILASRDTPAAVFGWPSVHEVRKRPAFGASFENLKTNVCQDRLGTNVKEMLKRTAFLQGAGTTFTSKAGCYVMCAAAENLAFFASVAVDSTKKLRLPGSGGPAAPPAVLNRSRSYITFQTNEG